MNTLEAKNEEIESDLKDKIKEFAVFNKESNTHNKELKEQMHEQEKKLKKMERVNKGLTEHVNCKEMQMNGAHRNQRNRHQRQREGSCRVRNKELKKEGCEHRKKENVKVRRRQKNVGM